MGRRERNSKPPRGTDARARGGWANYPNTTEAAVGEGGTGGSREPSKEHVNKYNALALEHKKIKQNNFLWGVLLLSIRLLHLGFIGAFLYNGYILHEHLVASDSIEVILPAIAAFLSIGLQLYGISIVGAIVTHIYMRKIRRVEDLANLVKFERVIKGG